MLNQEGVPDNSIEKGASPRELTREEILRELDDLKRVAREIYSTPEGYLDLHRAQDDFKKGRLPSYLVALAFNEDEQSRITGVSTPRAPDKTDAPEQHFDRAA